MYGQTVSFSSFSDFPLSGLVANRLASARGRSGLAVSAEDRAVVVAGSLAEMVCWDSGASGS